MNQIKKYSVIILLAFQFIYMLYWGMQKGGYYVDEFFTYDNAHFASSSTPDRIKLYDAELFQYEQWNEISDLKSTLTVQWDTSLLQDSFAYNVKMIAGNWGLYTVMLNYVEAIFFSGELNWWSALSINLVCYLITQIFIYLIVMKICNKRQSALLAMALYGFSGMATSMFVYVRFYTLAIMLLTIFTYIHVLMWKNDNIRRNIIFEIIAIALLYLAYCMSPLCAIYGAAIVLCFSIGVIAMKRWKQVLYYVVPYICGGLGYALLMTDYFQIFLNPRKALESGTLSSATSTLVSGVVSLSSDNILKRVTDILHIICRYTFGHSAVIGIYITAVLALTIFGLARKSNWKGNNDGEANGMLYVLIGGVIIYSMASVILNLSLIRYNSFMFPTIAIIASLVVNTWATDKKTSRIVAVIMTIAVIGEIYFTASIPRIENLYASEKEDINKISEYKGIDSVVMDYTFDDKVMYECLAFADENTRVIFTFYGDTEYDNLPDTFLYWQTVNKEFDIRDNLESAGYYQLEEIASTHESVIYMCKR